MTNTPEGSAMSEPVAYKIVPINMVTTSENERDKWIKAGHEVEALYPASAYEALKAENEAQAKRIAELEKNSRDFTELCKVNDEAIVGYIAKIKELEEALGADPKVIAAAPDLLEALCDMVSDQEYLSSKTIESAKKALEKALGVEAYWRCELLTEDKKQND